jgi:hypothetical protein
MLLYAILITFSIELNFYLETVFKYLFYHVFFTRMREIGTLVGTVFQRGNSS